jgi:ATP-dependent Clp protease ATP-binding subunit ClpX
MENVEIEFRDEALKAVAQKAMERKTGARGLRSILESVLLPTMFDLPDQANVVKVVVNEQSITGESEPLMVLDNVELQHAASDE